MKTAVGHSTFDGSQSTHARFDPFSFVCHAMGHALNTLRHAGSLLPGAAAVLLVVWINVPSRAQSLPAAGSNLDLWIVDRGEDDRFAVLHRRRGDPLNTYRDAATIRGRLLRGGLAAHNGRLWLVYENLSVHSVEALGPGPQDGPGEQGRYGLAIEHPLPEGLSLRSIAANKGGLWALVRVEQASTLELIDGAVPEGAGGAPPEDAGSEGADPEGTRARATREDRLIRLDRNDWAKVELPGPWPKDARAWVVLPSVAQPRPNLVVLAPTGRGRRSGNGDETAAPDEPGSSAGETVWVFAFEASASGEADAWEKTQYHTDLGPTLVPLGVDGQLVLAAAREVGAQLHVEIVVLRAGRVVPIGTLRIEAPASRTDWCVVRAGATVAVVAGAAQGQLRWSRMDLRGDVWAQDAPLEPRKPVFDHGPFVDNLVLIAVLAVTTLFMVAFWRRDPSWSTIELPEDVQVADLGSRAIAGIVDLGPCVLVVAATFGPAAVRQWLSWAGGGTGYEAMASKLTAIALFVVHTTLTELFTSRTLGKVVMRLGVAGSRGERPRPWQILVRNLFKTMDLLVPPLLITMIISPHRQRLGDLVARTVVVGTGVGGSRPGGDRS